MRLPYDEGENDGQNLTPLIDVVFLLLIFFLVATRFDEEEREIETRLPEVAEAQPLTRPPDDLVVNINNKGLYLVVGETYDPEDLGALLRQLGTTNPHQRVHIRADQRVPWAYPAQVMGFCERENIEHFCSVLPEKGS